MRIGLLALSGALLFPAAAAAQMDQGHAPEPHPAVLPFAGFAVTPYLGFRVPYGTGDYYLTFTDGSQLVVRDERGGGSALGLMVEGQVHGPLSVVAAGTFSTGTPDDVFIPFEDGVQRIRFDGPNIFFARAGLSYRLPEPDPDTRRFHPAAALSVGPAMVWTRPRGFDDFGVELSRNRSHFALSVAADAAQRIGTRGLAFSLGLENYLTFWNAEGIRARDEALFTDLFQQPVGVLYDRTHANILLLRAGVSFRH
jgi:hypothetical protein